MPVNIIVEDKDKAAPAVQKPAKKTARELSASHDEQMGKLTEEELKAQQDEWLSGFGYGPKKPKEKKPAPAPDAPKEPEKKEDEPALDPSTKKETDVPAETPTEPKPDKPEPKPEPAPTPAEDDDDEDALADRVADRVSKRMEKPEPKPAPVDAGLNDEDKNVLAAVALLQKDPRFKGKNLQAETMKFWKEEEDYARAWEKDHPGEKFEPGNDEHVEFYARVRPSYDSADLSNAQEELRVQEIERRAEERAMRRVQPQIDEIKLERAVQAAAPKIVASRDDAVKTMMVAAVPEFEPIMKEHGRGPDALKKMEEAHPLAMELLNEEAGALRVRVEELERLNHLGQMYKPDTDMVVELESGGTVMPYRDILAAGTKLESRIQAQPPEKQIHEGKRFISRSDFSQRVKAVQDAPGSREEKQAKMDRLFDRYWFIELGDIREFLINQSAAKVKKVLSKIPKPAAPAAGKPASNGTGDAHKPAARTTPNPPPSPAAVSSTVNTQIPGSQVDVSDDQILAKMRGW